MQAFGETPSAFFMFSLRVRREVTNMGCGSKNGDSYKVTNQSSSMVKAPLSQASGQKPQVNKGGDLRSKGSK